MEQDLIQQQHYMENTQHTNHSSLISSVKDSLMRTKSTMKSSSKPQRTRSIRFLDQNSKKVGFIERDALEDTHKSSFASNSSKFLSNSASKLTHFAVSQTFSRSADEFDANLSFSNSASDHEDTNSLLVFNRMKSYSSDHLSRCKHCPTQFVLKEAVAMERCRHPNIAQFYGIVLRENHELEAEIHELDERKKSIQKQVCFVMEYAKVGTLKDLMDCEDLSSLDWNGRRELLLQIACGMEYLHSDVRSIFHRDLKPENVLICAGNIAKITDFGLAETYTNSMKAYAQHDKLIGTAVYLAPELAYYDNDADASVVVTQKWSPEAAEVYAFGVMAWMICHRNTGVCEYLDMNNNSGAIDVFDNQENDELDRYLSRAVKLLLGKGGNGTASHRFAQVMCFKNLEGFQLRCSREVPEDLQELVRICTAENPNSRPDFTSLVFMLQQ
uniref:Protein kinase domain-containing protein n=2 Tax=Timspurckia oligopyrenoides TaxID=708627 RepID=A0A7S1EPT8_9RHOD